jgi:2-amino-4-hydroxy-6-hydroxymethyldihydropteridine diphosphokinase
MMGGIFLLLGSNLGNSSAQLDTAIRHITSFATVIRKSSVYVSQAWGNTNQPDFLNQVIEIDSDLEPQELLDHTLRTETTMGRDRILKWGPRTIDIDILFYRNDIVKTGSLTIPHPEIQNRKFELVPLRELAPDLFHPVLKKTISQIDDECTDTLSVTKR